MSEKVILKLSMQLSRPIDDKPWTFEAKAEAIKFGLEAPIDISMRCLLLTEFNNAAARGQQVGS